MSQHTEGTVNMLKIDTGSYRIFVDGHEIRLTPKEFRIARVFAENPGRLVTRSKLGFEVWGHGEPGRTLDMHISTLRRKVSGIRITTLRGVGFRLDSPAEIVN